MYNLSGDEFDSFNGVGKQRLQISLDELELEVMFGDDENDVNH